MVKLKGLQKIAVLLAVMGGDIAARLLKQFEDDEQARITQAILELDHLDLDSDGIQGIINDFRALVATGGSAIPNIEKTLSELLSCVHGVDEAKRRIEQLREDARTSHPFRVLRGLRSFDLAKVLLGEHPQVQAIVLAHLESEHAASVLDAMPEEMRPGLVSRMALVEDPPARLLKQVAHEIIERTRGLKREEDRDPERADPRLETVAKILLNAMPGTDKGVLDGISVQSQDLAQRIRNRMFEWNDIMAIDRRTMQRVLADIDTRLLALALKACDDEVRDKMLAAVSSRTAEMILQEKDLLGSVPLKEVKDAQTTILAAIRELISKGEITVARGKAAVHVA